MSIKRIIVDMDSHLATVLKNSGQITILETVETDKPIDLQETTARLPTKTFKELWHVGHMNPQLKRDGSYEGSGLSVSLNPEEWRKIARGHVSGDLWRCVRPGNKFLNFHKTTKAQRRMIEDWGVANGLATRSSIWRVAYYDEDDSEHYMEFSTREEAEEEADGFDYEDGEGITEVPGGLLPTPLFHRRTKTNSKTVDLGLLATLYVEDATDLDGVWWSDVLDVARLSAPRGVIVPARLGDWVITRQQA